MDIAIAKPLGWIDDHRAAIEASNDQAEEQGLVSDGLRNFGCLSSRRANAR